MNILKEATVTLTFEVRAEKKDAPVSDSADSANPIKFIYGIGLMLPSFEKRILGKKAGDTFEFELSSEESYGSHYEDAVFDVPKKIFEVDGKFNDDYVKVGVFIPMNDDKGNQRNGKVVEIKDTDITMDFNHPLAGKKLYFSGTIISVEDTSAEELKKYQHECCGKHEHESDDNSHD